MKSAQLSRLTNYTQDTQLYSSLLYAMAGNATVCPKIIIPILVQGEYYLKDREGHKILKTFYNIVTLL